MSIIDTLIYLNDSGTLQVLPNGSIVNIAGTNNPNFTVNGLGVILENGQSSSGTGLSLQTVYSNSLDENGNASIKLTTGKDLVVYDDTNNAIFFKIDSETGKITITGDLEILGSSSVYETAIQSADHWLIAPLSPAVTALKIEPKFTSPLVDLVNIRHVQGGVPVFRIDKDGNVLLNTLSVSQSLSVNGSLIINGITISGTDLAGIFAPGGLQDRLTGHLTFNTTPKHAASEISVIAPSIVPSATNVQDIVNALPTLIQPSGFSGCYGFEHVVTVASDTWYIEHLGGTKKVQVTIYDENDEVIMPDRISLVDIDSMFIYFGAPQTGRAVLVMFK